jgi:hypothetical protein
MWGLLLHVTLGVLGLGHEFHSKGLRLWPWALSFSHKLQPFSCTALSEMQHVLKYISLLGHVLQNYPSLGTWLGTTFTVNLRLQQLSCSSL